MILSKFRNSNFLESVGIKFETNQCSRRGILEANFRAHASKTQVFVANNIEIDRKHALVLLRFPKTSPK